MKSLLPVIILVFVSCKNGCGKPPEENSIDDTGVENKSNATTESININAVGDMMLGSDFPSAARLPGKNILKSLEDTLKNADLTIGNLEGVIASPSTTTQKCKDSKNCFVFRMPVYFSSYFKDAGFDFLSLANNHSGDFGDRGIKETMDVLKKEGIAFAGLKNICEYSFVESKGLKVGFIGVGHGGRHVHINQSDYVKGLIQKVKPQCDVLVVFFHGGAEGSDKEHVPKTTETLHGENRGNVYDFAHRCIDAGADLIIGSGPHVTRGMELYKNKLIAYSLGNFATYSMSTHGPLGFAPILNVNISSKGDFISGRLIPTIQFKKDPLTPKIDNGKKVIARVRELSQSDFPRNTLQINTDGTLTIKNF